MICKLPIDDAPVRVKFRGAPVELCASCAKSIRSQPAERRAEARSRLEPVIARIPEFCVRFDAPEFSERVKSPRLAHVARRYEPDQRGSLALIGPAGTGKTLTAGAIVLRLADEVTERYVADKANNLQALGRVAHTLWVTAFDLCNARRQHQLGAGEAPLFLRAERAPFLVLDEVGQETGDSSWLLEFLNVRYAAGFPTLSTSGLTRSQLEQRFGSGAVRRLVEPHGQFVDLFEAR